MEETPVVVFLAGGEFEGESIEATAIMSISPRHTSTITSHRIEEGASVSDHIYTNNVVIEMTGEFSNMHLDYKISNYTNFIDGVSRDQDAWSLLKSLYDKHQPITIVSRFETYENCYITTLIPLDETDTGETLRFTMNLEQVRFAYLQEEEASGFVLEDKKDQTASKEDGGNKTQESSEESGEDDASGSRFIKKGKEILDILLPSNPEATGQ